MEEETQTNNHHIPHLRPEAEYYAEKYDINIESLDLGYKVRVGCKSFAITSTEVLINMLTKYLNNPSQIQEQFHNKTLEFK